MRVFVAALLAMSICSTATAQTIDPQGPRIVVTGKGVASRIADWGKISISIRGEGATVTEALKALTTAQDALSESLVRLKGTSAVVVSSDKVDLQEVRGMSCRSDGEYLGNQMLSKGDCAVVGFVAALSMSAKIAPAERTGDGVSLAAQMGATSVSIDDGGLDNRDQLRAQATAVAMTNAQRQAADIALASGLELGPVLLVQYPQADDASSYEAAMLRRPAPAAQTAPIVPLSLSPQPIEAIATLTVTFSARPKR